MSTRRNEAMEQQAGTRTKKRSSCKICNGYYGPWDHRMATARGKTCLDLLKERERYTSFLAALKARVESKR